MTTFYEDLGRGKVGEKWVKNYWKRKGAVVYDVSNKPYCQEQDVDFLVMCQGKGLKVEVKTDYVAATSGNIAIEFDTGGTPGWFLKTEATLIFFVIMDEWAVREVYYTKTEDLKKYIFENYDKIMQKGMGDSRESGYQGRGFLIPKTEKIFKKIQ